MTAVVVGCALFALGMNVVAIVIVSERLEAFRSRGMNGGADYVMKGYLRRAFFRAFGAAVIAYGAVDQRQAIWEFVLLAMAIVLVAVSISDWWANRRMVAAVRRRRKAEDR